MTDADDPDDDDGNSDDAFDPDMDVPRGLIDAPSDDLCKNGHLDWEVLMKGTKLVVRCRVCGDERPYDGQLLTP